ncbi:ABC transporter ATP-binding protein [Marinicrinis lubricantis]|uniref:ABC transporter ATP-binding protein n=1 Tax=Marinicrinis lubricantis TaxID=2086470 RepID=A0ABW1IR80_9BACL
MDSIMDVRIEEAGYSEQKASIFEIEFSLYPGELVGLIGPNGAGKSTTIKAILGLLRHMKGDVRFKSGEMSWGYIPEQPVYYNQMTLFEHMALAAAVYGMSKEQLKTRGDMLLERFKLKHVKHHYPTSFSKGMKQKMMLIIGFLHSPSIYIIDEPFIGLDPQGMQDLLEFLGEERRRGAAVLMSTHVLDTAEKICERFLVMREGQLIVAGDLEEIRSRSFRPEGSLFECFQILHQGVE